MDIDNIEQQLSKIGFSKIKAESVFLKFINRQQKPHQFFEYNTIDKTLLIDDYMHKVSKENRSLIENIFNPL